VRLLVFIKKKFVTMHGHMNVKYVDMRLPSGFRDKERAQLLCKTFSCYWTILLLLRSQLFSLQFYKVKKIAYMNCFKPKAWTQLTPSFTSAS
jgi:hypothetical protein